MHKRDRPKKTTPSEPLRKRVLIPHKRVRSAPYPEDAYPVGFFGARHGLSPAQAREAQRLFDQATARRGRVKGRRLALRMGGIVSAILGGRVGNATWGLFMLAARGGKTLARHAPHHLRAISRRGVEARQALKEMRRRYGRRYG